jgi:hypothetical protein
MTWNNRTAGRTNRVTRERRRPRLRSTKSWGKTQPRAAAVQIVSWVSRDSRIAAAGKAWKIFVAVLREIFDENAYSRFLKRTNAHRSVESYGDFVREQDVAAAGRARCC